MSDLPRLMTLQEAAGKLGGAVTARSLRTEANKGRLHLTRVAGKYFVTDSDLREMIERCRAAPRDHGSGCSSGMGGSLSGSSSTPDASTAQAAAKATAQALKERLAATSRKNTSRQLERAR